jgi:hypothetical protein
MFSVLQIWIKNFCLYCANFFSIGSTLSSSKISSFLLCSNKFYPAVLLMNFISVVSWILTSLCMRLGYIPFYRTSWYNGYHLNFVFGRSRVRSSARRLVVLTGLLCYFQHVQTSSEAVSSQRLWPLLWQLLQFVIHKSSYNYMLYNPRSCKSIVKQPYIVLPRTQRWIAQSV